MTFGDEKLGPGSESDGEEFGGEPCCNIGGGDRLSSSISRISAKLNERLIAII